MWNLSALASPDSQILLCSLGKLPVSWAPIYPHALLYHGLEMFLAVSWDNHWTHLICLQSLHYCPLLPNIQILASVVSHTLSGFLFVSGRRVSSVPTTPFWLDIKVIHHVVWLQAVHHYDRFLIICYSFQFSFRMWYQNLIVLSCILTKSVNNTIWLNSISKPIC